MDLHLLGHMTEADEKEMVERYNIKRIWINTRLIMKRFKYALDGLKILIQKDYKFFYMCLQ